MEEVKTTQICHYLASVDVVDDLSEDDRLVLGEADGGLWAAGGDGAAWDDTHLPT